METQETKDKSESSYPDLTIRMKDMPERMRPRELFEQLGAENVSDETLLALILRSGTAGVNVLDLARNLLKEYRSLRGIAKASVEELSSIRGMGRVKAQVLKASLEMAHRLSQEDAAEQPTMRGPEDAARLVRERARTLEQEVFWVLLLDTRRRLKKPPVQISRGLLDASLVHPREVFGHAIKASASAVVLMHNHPSGDPTPSAEDVRISRQLVEAGRVVDIPVLDHIIVGNLAGARETDFVSLRESGVVQFTS